MPRPTVNLDPIAAILDRVLAHPVAAVARELLPETVGTIQSVRDELPAIASGLEARAVDTLREEARALEQELVGATTRWIRETIRKGKGHGPVKRLRAPRAAAAARTAKKKGKGR